MKKDINFTIFGSVFIALLAALIFWKWGHVRQAYSISEPAQFSLQISNPIESHQPALMQLEPLLYPQGITTISGQKIDPKFFTHLGVNDSVPAGTLLKLRTTIMGNLNWNLANRGYSVDMVPNLKSHENWVDIRNAWLGLVSGTPSGETIYRHDGWCIVYFYTEDGIVYDILVRKSVIHIGKWLEFQFALDALPFERISG